MRKNTPALVWFADADTDDDTQIGSAGQKLGKMAQAGFPIPPGFIITSGAYFQFLRQNKLEHKIKSLLSTTNFELPETIGQISNHIKRHFYKTPFSVDLMDDLILYYKKLNTNHLSLQAYSLIKNSPKHVTLTSTNFKEFALKIKDSWASHFSADLLAHRNEHDLDHLRTGSTLIIQSILEPQKRGIVMTVDPQSHTKNKVIIYHNSDRYELSKKTLTILDRELKHHSLSPKLTHTELLQIARLGKELEKHLYFPQEIEWGIIDNQIYILSIRPISTLPQTRPEPKRRLPIARGISLTPTIGSGTVKIIEHARDLKYVQPHDILVLEHITKTHLPHLKKIRGIITEKIQKHSDITVNIRQHGIPTILGVPQATKHFKNGHLITIHGGKGEIYKGGFLATTPHKSHSYTL